MKRLLLVLTYYMSALLFAAATLLLNMLSWPMVLLRQGGSDGRAVRRLVRWMFQKWTQWFAMSGILSIDWTEVPATLPEGVLYVANHPSLIDATLLLSRVPNAICIAKPSLISNGFVGPAARLCGYIPGGSLLRLSREVRKRMASGCALLIFPEGTRTAPGSRLGRIKPGFAHLAIEAKVPVQLLVVEMSEGLGAKGAPWWRVPAVLPARARIRLGPRREFRDNVSPRELSAWVEAELQAALGLRQPVLV